MLQRRALPQTVATGSEPVSLTMVAMVHYHVFAEPFVLVVIRGALDKAKKLQPLVADNPLARAACGWAHPLTAVLKLHVV